MTNKVLDERMVTALTKLLVQFDKERWLKMATRKDLAEYIIGNGFCPSSNVLDYQKGIRDLNEIINDYYDEEYGIIDEKGVKKLKAKIYSLIGEK